MLDIPFWIRGRHYQVALPYDVNLFTNEYECFVYPTSNDYNHGTNRTLDSIPHQDLIPIPLVFAISEGMVQVTIPDRIP